MLGFMSLAIIESVGDSPIAGGDAGVFVASLLLSVTTGSPRFSNVCANNTLDFLIS
jgi:hypothetical protein